MDTETRTYYFCPAFFSHRALVFCSAHVTAPDYIAIRQRLRIKRTTHTYHYFYYYHHHYYYANTWVTIIIDQTVCDMIIAPATVVGGMVAQLLMFPRKKKRWRYYYIGIQLGCNNNSKRSPMRYALIPGCLLTESYLFAVSQTPLVHKHVKVCSECACVCECVYHTREFWSVTGSPYVYQYTRVEWGDHQNYTKMQP